MNIQEFVLSFELEKVRMFISENRKKFEEAEGIFIQSDHLYIMMLDFFKEKSMAGKVIIGYDNMEILNYFSPKIATIDQNMECMISQGITYLLSLLKNTDQEKKIYNAKPYLVKGEKI
ncbi:MAG: hypothetical protein ACRC6U_01210 [Fusobacteriaceae bacterium]